MLEKDVAAGIFFCVNLRPFMGPCTNAKYLNFSLFDQKKSHSEKNSIFQKHSEFIFFHLHVLSFNLKQNDNYYKII